MDRINIIKTVGEAFLVSNIENGEFSYAKVLSNVNRGHYKLDIRFFDSSSKVAVLIETKPKYKPKDKKQLFDYVGLEQTLNSSTKIIAILANTSNDDIKVWKILGDSVEELADEQLKSFAEYKKYFEKQNRNDKTAVLNNTATLNKILLDNGIPAKLRSQFVGTCLLALKNELKYKGLSTEQIIAGIKSVLSSLLKDDIERAKKLVILEEKILENQQVASIKSESFEKLLTFHIVVRTFSSSPDIYRLSY